MEQEKDEKNVFFVIHKKDFIGVYKSLSDCQAQFGSTSVCDPSIKVFKGYSLPKEAEEYLASHGLKTASYSMSARDVREDLFGTLVACPFQQPASSKGEASKTEFPEKRSQELLESDGDHQRSSQSIHQDVCYCCKNQGHWARDCPNKPMKKSGTSSVGSTIIEGPDFPEMLCHCGAGLCLRLTSNTDRNPGRKFYRCPSKANKGRGCGYFQWCDMVNPDKKYEFSPSSYPMCSCGAGRCTLSVETCGKNMGRKFFVCPVKKGQGACNFFQWQDAS